jgi:hypothetical protein
MYVIGGWIGAAQYGLWKLLPSSSLWQEILSGALWLVLFGSLVAAMVECGAMVDRLKAKHAETLVELHSKVWDLQSELSFLKRELESHPHE